MTAIIAVAHDLATVQIDGNYERVSAGYYLRYTKLDGVRRLIVARRDRLPSPEELEAIAAAAGAPVGCEPTRTLCAVLSQDGIITRLPALVIGWRVIT